MINRIIALFSKKNKRQMKRESLTLDEALNQSLAAGDYRRVDWTRVA